MATNVPQVSSAADKIANAASYDSKTSKVSYDDNIDYQERINAAAAAGDYTSAAAYERQRNAKIDASGNSKYQKTNNYQQYLEKGAQSSGSTYYDKNTDYQAEIDKATAAGDMTTAALLERQRNAKIQGEGMTDQKQTKDYTQYKPESSKNYNGTEYNSELDYMAGMMDAVQRGDLETARRLEEQRNAKIDGDKLGYEKTNLFGKTEDVSEPAEDPVLPSGGGQSSNSSGGYRYSDVLRDPNDMLAQMVEQLNKWREAAASQSELKRDYAVEKGITELQRALEDAQSQFQTQRDQVSTDERKALDNSALYAEARGDRGGIGQEQYNLIQSSAAKNRLAVSQAQTKLSTDTSRQIADLRAQGEFSKADDLLALAQTYLSQLTQLQQWQASYAMDYAQFQEAIRQWEAEYELQKAQIMGTLDGETTLAGKQFEQSNKQWQSEFDWDKEKWQSEFDQSNKQWQAGYDLDKEQLASSNRDSEQDRLASIGKALLSGGVIPSDEQLAAMGMTKAQAQDYLTAQGLASAKSSSGSGSSNSGGSGKWTNNTTTPTTENTKSSFTGKTRDAAIAYMTKNGVDAGSASRVMTESEWNRRKQSSRVYGSGGLEVTEYSTYADYLRAYVEFATQK